MRIKIFFCYAREDEALLQDLEKQLRILRRQGLIDIWCDRDISAGADREREIKKHLDSSQIILLLISPDFMASDYCAGVEVKRAMERHQRGEARVIPVILRPTLWREASFGKLQALPEDGRPLSSWPERDAAFYDIVTGILHTIEDFLGLKDYPEQVARAIRDCYCQLAEAPAARLGAPVPLRSDEVQQVTSVRGTVGYVRTFAGGGILWSERAGAHPVSGPIMNLWGRPDVGDDICGYPLTHEHPATASPQGTLGTFQRFEGRWDYPEDIVGSQLPYGATIYWSKKYGAHPTWGGIGQYYESMGGTGSFLGFPTAPERECTPSSYGTTGSSQAFEGGLIFWCAKYKSVHMDGAMASVYNRLDGTDGRLGFPTAPAQQLDGDMHMQEFEGGVLCLAR
ncbi:MAG TPA: TIR domain-containing protein [Ktedonobacteraceae bacterium]|jgi:hypothetical protein